MNPQKGKKVHNVLNRASEVCFKGLGNESYTKNYRNRWNRQIKTSNIKKKSQEYSL